MLERALVFVAAVGVSACGGKVVWVGGGGGADATSSTSTTLTTSATTNASTGSGPADCQSLQAALDQAVTEAQACDPEINIEQCDGSETLDDDCGCMNGIVLNETQPQKVAKAKAAHQAWLDAHCGPLACGEPCFSGNGGACEPGTNGAMGMCVPVILN